MKGLKISLKKKGLQESESKKEPKISFSFDKSISKSKSRPLSKTTSSQANQKAHNVLAESESESDDGNKKIGIDFFDERKGGAMSGNRAINVKTKEKPLVITPPELNKDLIKKSTYIPNQEHKKQIVVGDEEKLKYGLNEFERTAKSEKEVIEVAELHKSKEEHIRESLLSGESIESSKGLTIKIPSEEDLFEKELADKPDEDTIEEYDKVPVEQFGAALLRGMGWKPESKKEKKTNSIIEKRKKGILLGIGAKAVEDEIMEDLIAKKGTKFEIPLLQKDRETGEIISDSDKRDSSPARKEKKNYRNR